MQNNRLNFLDTTIYWDGDTSKFELDHFQKSTKSDCILNFNRNIVPKNTKIGVLMGEIYRCRSTTTTEGQLQNALEKLKVKFLKNGYSEQLISEKIQEIKSRNFEKSPKSNRYKELKKDPTKKFHIFSTQFIDSRCQFIERTIKKYLNKITPDFIINFCWSSKSLESIILPKLKENLEPLQKSGTVYQFTCPCKKRYIGETTRQLIKRIQEHGQKSRNSEVYAHTSQCEHYKSEIAKFCSDERKTTGLFYLKKCFTILQSNLIHYNERQVSESIYIHLFKPELNIQNTFRKLTLL